MIFVEPADLLCQEVISDEFNHFQFQVLRLTRIKKWTNNIRVLLAFLPPAAELNTNLFTQVTREDLIHFHLWVGQPEHSHVRLGMFHSVVGYYMGCFFWRWTRDGFDPLLCVMVLSLSSVEVQGTLLPLEGTGL
jgi:hypothetical protein